MDEFRRAAEEARVRYASQMGFDFGDPEPKSRLKPASIDAAAPRGPVTSKPAAPLKLQAPPLARTQSLFDQPAAAPAAQKPAPAAPAPAAPKPAADLSQGLLAMPQVQQSVAAIKNPSGYVKSIDPNDIKPAQREVLHAMVAASAKSLAPKEAPTKEGSGKTRRLKPEAEYARASKEARDFLDERDHRMRGLWDRTFAYTPGEFASRKGAKGQSDIKWTKDNVVEESKRSEKIAQAYLNKSHDRSANKTKSAKQTGVEAQQPGGRLPEAHQLGVEWDNLIKHPDAAERLSALRDLKEQVGLRKISSKQFDAVRDSMLKEWGVQDKAAGKVEPVDPDEDFEDRFEEDNIDKKTGVQRETKASKQGGSLFESQGSGLNSLMNVLRQAVDKSQAKRRESRQAEIVKKDIEANRLVKAPAEKPPISPPSAARPGAAAAPPPSLAYRVRVKDR